MKLHGTMQINSKGHLSIGGCDAVALATEFGTPLYVMDEALLRENCRAYVDAFRRFYPHSAVLYASKAFCAMAMCRLAQEEGLGLDVVSGGELYTALQAGFPAQHIYFHGNNKTPQEMELALHANVGRIVVDNLSELQLLQELAQEKKAHPRVLLRVSPGIDAHTHHYIKTGMIDSKFGLAIANGQAMLGVERILAAKNLEFKGLHCHIGSQIFELSSYREAAKVMVEFMQQVRASCGATVEELNLGGGLGIYYTSEDTPQPVDALVRTLAAAVREAAGHYGLPLPKLIVEPGRSLVSEAGTTLYTIGAIKDIPGIRKYVAVDGGMTDNPRPALYQAKYEAAVANKMQQPAQEVVSIAGKCCESGDMLIWDIKLPRTARGDILAVACTGAYNYAMASNYNRNARPAVVFVHDGVADLVVRRENYADLVQNDVLPERFCQRKAHLA